MDWNNQEVAESAAFAARSDIISGRRQCIGTRRRCIGLSRSKEKRCTSQENEHRRSYRHTARLD